MKNKMRRLLCIPLSLLLVMGSVQGTAPASMFTVYADDTVGTVIGNGATGEDTLAEEAGEREDSSNDSLEVSAISGLGQGDSLGGSEITWSGATEITGETSTTGATYTSTSSGENAVLIDTDKAVTLTNPTVTKSGGTSAGDNESFYGINSAVMCKGGGTTTITGANVTTKAPGANGVFSYGGNPSTNASEGDGTTVVISNSTITTTGNGSGGIMTTGQGITKASNLTVNTSGGSSAAIRSDRGGGTVTVDGGTYVTSGTGSPAIYATATINVSNATLTSTSSQGVVNEGGNTVILSDCTVNAGNTTLGSQDNFRNGVFLYQSMSGDASEGASVFKMTGGNFNNSNGHVFHVTNTSASITLEDVAIENSDSENVLISVCDDAWSGLNNTATLNANNQTLEGDLLVGSGDSLTVNLSGTSTWTGTTSGQITSHRDSSTISSSLGTIDLVLSDTATIKLSGDTTISSLSGTGYIDYNGYTLTVGSVSYSSGNIGNVEDKIDGSIISMNSVSMSKITIGSSYEVTYPCLLPYSYGKGKSKDFYKLYGMTVSSNGTEYAVTKGKVVLVKIKDGDGTFTLDYYLQITGLTLMENGQVKTSLTNDEKKAAKTLAKELKALTKVDKKVAKTGVGKSSSGIHTRFYPYTLTEENASDSTNGLLNMVLSGKSGKYQFKYAYTLTKKKGNVKNGKKDAEKDLATVTYDDATGLITVNSCQIQGSIAVSSNLITNKTKDIN